MKIEMEFSKVEIVAMIEANVTAKWPCIPGHRWEATWEKYDDSVKVNAVEVKAVNADAAAVKED